MGPVAIAVLSARMQHLPGQNIKQELMKAKTFI